MDISSLFFKTRKIAKAENAYNIRKLISWFTKPIPRTVPGPFSAFLDGEMLGTRVVSPDSPPELGVPVNPLDSQEVQGLRVRI